MTNSITADLQKCFSSCEPSLVRGLKLSVPELFDRKNFIDWLNNSDAMTWHKKGEPYIYGGYADVTVFVDPSLSGEGSDDDMPGWDFVVELVKAQFGPGPFEGNHFVVVLSNC